MESLSNMYRRARRKAFNFFDRVSFILRLLFQALSPLWSWILRIPGVEFLCLRARLLCVRVQKLASLTWRGSRNEQSEKNQWENGFSSDEEGNRVGPYSGPTARSPSEVPEIPDKPPEVRVENEFSGNEYRVDETDDFYCDYDSTWETEHEKEKESPPRRRTYQSRRNRTYKFTRFENAAKDMQNYRHDYPNLHRTRHFEQENDEKPNLRFYLRKMASLPDEIYIDQFHNEWKGKYAKLEHTHSYIQWLFPLQEPGMNSEAKTLTKQEIQDFLDSPTARKNLLESYKLMLDFYGIKLENEETGEVARAAHWSDRFQNLNNHTHNNLRITRILKCLGTLGYRHYQVPLVRFFLEETLVKGELQRVKDSALSYFLFAVLDKQERRKLLKFAYDNYDDTEPFVWCPKKIQDAWSKPWQEQDQFSSGGNGWDNTSTYNC
ncbi:opioid growth factor receptor-like protein 1 [Poecilia reticulata]|uniref:opioid growth factor receptor-like protein 1 n=1 Tax=Poecilia reticulata TaxID=8081 RepID=UPI0004A3E336|nr:PREDICTED: opioid growth factor receptor-like protein 1 [Poecilia reticulata]